MRDGVLFSNVRSSGSRLCIGCKKLRCICWDADKRKMPDHPKMVDDSANSGATAGDVPIQNWWNYSNWLYKYLFSNANFIRLLDTRFLACYLLKYNTLQVFIAKIFICEQSSLSTYKSAFIQCLKIFHSTKWWWQPFQTCEKIMLV